MKKFISVAVLSLVLCMVFQFGVLRGKSTSTTQTEALIEEASGTKEKAAVDVASRGYGYGWLTIYKGGGEFDHVPGIVDYQPGDPLGLYSGDNEEEVIGIYVRSGDPSKIIKNWAILSTGEEIRLDSQWFLLPRSSGKFCIAGEEGNATRVFLDPISQTSEYILTVEKNGKEEIRINNVLDAWAAYDTVYWLVGDKAYKLDWEEADAQPELYCENAYAISHNSDEAEGALVTKGANYSAYGQSDIYSPYGSPFPYGDGE